MCLYIHMSAHIIICMHEQCNKLSLRVTAAIKGSSPNETITNSILFSFQLTELKKWPSENCVLLFGKQITTAFFPQLGIY